MINLEQTEDIKDDDNALMFHNITNPETRGSNCKQATAQLSRDASRIRQGPREMN